jgi:hypothetical protein
MSFGEPFAHQEGTAGLGGDFSPLVVASDHSISTPLDGSVISAGLGSESLDQGRVDDFSAGGELVISAASSLNAGEALLDPSVPPSGAVDTLSPMPTTDTLEGDDMISMQFDIVAKDMGMTASEWLLKSEFLGATAYMAVCYLLTFTAFNSAASTLTSLFPDFGAINLLIIFATFGISSLFVPLFIVRLHPKWLIFVSSVGFTLWIGALMTGVLPLVIVASVVVGMCTAITWVSNGTYVARSRTGSRGANLFWFIFFASWYVINTRYTFVSLLYSNI